MKKQITISIVICIVLIILGGVVILLFNLDKSPNIEEFDLARYQWEIENFPSDKNVGQIGDGVKALKKAKELWMETFKPYNPINGRKIELSYDAQNECWHINGTLSPNMLGSVPHSLIQKDGKVLAVWMG